MRMGRIFCKIVSGVDKSIKALVDDWLIKFDYQLFKELVLNLIQKKIIIKKSFLFSINNL